MCVLNPPTWINVPSNGLWSSPALCGSRPFETTLTHSSPLINHSSPDVRSNDNPSNHINQSSSVIDRQKAPHSSTTQKAQVFSCWRPHQNHLKWPDYNISSVSPRVKILVKSTLCRGVSLAACDVRPGSRSCCILSLVKQLALKGAYGSKSLPPLPWTLLHPSIRYEAAHVAGRV